MTAVSPISADPIWAHPSDDRVYYIDITRAISSGVPTTIASVTSITDLAGVLTISGAAVNTGQLVLGDGSIVRPSNSIKCQVSGGVTGTDYTIRCTVVLSDGSTLVRNVLLKVIST